MSDDDDVVNPILLESIVDNNNIIPHNLLQLSEATRDDKIICSTVGLVQYIEPPQHISIDNNTRLVELSVICIGDNSSKTDQWTKLCIWNPGKSFKRYVDYLQIGDVALFHRVRSTKKHSLKAVAGFQVRLLHRSGRFYPGCSDHPSLFTLTSLEPVLSFGRSVLGASVIEGIVPSSGSISYHNVSDLREGMVSHVKAQITVPRSSSGSRNLHKRSRNEVVRTVVMIDDSDKMLLNLTGKLGLPKTLDLCNESQYYDVCNISVGMFEDRLEAISTADTKITPCPTVAERQQSNVVFDCIEECESHINNTTTLVISGLSIKNLEVPGSKQRSSVEPYRRESRDLAEMYCSWCHRTSEVTCCPSPAALCYRYRTFYLTFQDARGKVIRVAVQDSGAQKLFCNIPAELLFEKKKVAAFHPVWTVNSLLESLVGSGPFSATALHYRSGLETKDRPLWTLIGLK